MSLSADISLIDKILAAMTRIENYIKKYDLDKFINDDKTQDAVFRNIIIIGNSIENISSVTKDEFPDVEFSKLTAIAKYVSNDYFNEDNKIIWELVNSDMKNYNEIIIEIKDKLE